MPPFSQSRWRYNEPSTEPRKSSDDMTNSSESVEEDNRLLDSGFQEKGQYGARFRGRGSLVTWPRLSLAFNVITVCIILVMLGTSSFKHGGSECNCPSGDKFEPDLQYSSKVTFQPHAYFGGRPSNKTDEMWERLMPPGDGIVAIPKKYSAGLPSTMGSAVDPTMNVYGISMFHQLHCLDFLRYAYYPETVKDFPPEEVVPHRDHCLDYIRQGIMCMGDTTFEPVSSVGINGMGAVHQCRDFNRLFSWAYEHRSDKTHGSGYHGFLTHTPAHRNEVEG